MTSLITTPNISDPDGFYSELLTLHDGLDKASSDAINARLILILSNHIGDRAILTEAFTVARFADRPAVEQTHGKRGAL